MKWPKLRASEYVLLGFFAYSVAIDPLFSDRPHLHGQPVLVFLCAAVLLIITASWKRLAVFRDFLPIGLTLLAFQEMEFFVARSYDKNLEGAWIQWDIVLLLKWHLSRAIELLGPVVPGFLEFCYLLVYGLPFYCVGILYAKRRRDVIDRFFVIYLLGTLLSYSLFPFFPSRPPRLAFPKVAMPHVVTALRQLNLAILHSATIHVGVFPSAHVSSAFACAWAFFAIFGRRNREAWWLLAYGCCVSLATVYGRYHYSTDVVAGFGVSLVAAAWACIRRAGAGSGHHVRRSPAHALSLRRIEDSVKEK